VRACVRACVCVWCDVMYAPVSVTGISLIGTRLCLIVEFAFHGSLKEFLKLCRQHLDNQPPIGQPTPVRSSYLNDTNYYNDAKLVVAQPVSQFVTHYVNSDSDWYMYQQHSVNTSDYYNTNTSQLEKDYYTKLGRLSVLDIYFFMLQIAKGMEHIGKMKASKQP